MQHPVFYVKIVTNFLDAMIRDYGDYLFIAFGWFCILLIIWMFTHRRRHPVHDISLIILPLGQAPRREPELPPIHICQPPDCDASDIF